MAQQQTKIPAKDVLVNKIPTKSITSYSYLRRIAVFVLVLYGLCSTLVQPAWAQATPQQQAVAAQQQQDTEAVEKTAIATEQAAPNLESARAQRLEAQKALEQAIELGDSAAIKKAYEDFDRAVRVLSDSAIGEHSADPPDGADKSATAPDGQKNETSEDKKPGLISKLISPEGWKDLSQVIFDKLLSWFTSPAFLAMIAAIVLAWILAPIVARILRKRIPLFAVAPKKDAKLALVRHYIYETREFLRAIILIGLLAGFAAILKNTEMFGEDWLVKLAQGLAVVFLLYKVIKTFAPSDMAKKLGTWILIPLALLAVFGYFDDLIRILEGISFGSGDNPISVLTLIKLGIFGSLFFWLGNFSNKKGQSAIRAQEGLDVGVREIVSKFLQVGIFATAVFMALSAAGIPLSGLVMIVSAVGLGIGLGLQPVAANFVSGIIILFDRTVRVGDFVVLPDGQEGHVEAINMRSTTVETTDGKDIMVPNTTFIENAYENWTHKDPRQRYEVYFSVTYGTDIDKLEDILIPAVSAHPKVLQEPEEPDLELREFGDFGIKFAIEFWCSGIDDGPNKFTSDLNFIVWRTLRKHKIEMPLPQREVRILKDK